MDTINQQPLEPLLQMPAEKNSVKNTKYFTIVLTFVVILFILAPLVGYYIGSMQANKSSYMLIPQKQATASAQNIPITEVASSSSETLDALSVPPYTSPWKELSQAETNEYAKNVLEFVPANNKTEYGQLNLTGTSWQRTVRHQVYLKYTQLADLQGIDHLSYWSSSAKIPGYELDALNAGGPCGDTVGYVGHYDKALRIIVLWYSQGTCQGAGGAQVGNNPYDKLTIFESNIYTEEQILSLIKMSKVYK